MGCRPFSPLSHLSKAYVDWSCATCDEKLPTLVVSQFWAALRMTLFPIMSITGRMLNCCGPGLVSSASLLGMFPYHKWLAQMYLSWSNCESFYQIAAAPPRPEWKTLLIADAIDRDNCFLAPCTYFHRQLLVHPMVMAVSDWSSLRFLCSFIVLITMVLDQGHAKTLESRAEGFQVTQPTTGKTVTLNEDDDISIHIAWSSPPDIVDRPIFINLMQGTSIDTLELVETVNGKSIEPRTQPSFGCIK